MLNKTSFSAALVIFLLGFYVSISGASAQTNDVALPKGKSEHLATLPSSSEDIGMAFYYLAGKTPDFDALTRRGKLFQELDEVARQDFLNREPLRMEQKFTSLSPQNNPLVFRFPVPVRFVRTREGTSTISLDLRQGSKDPFYFPIFYDKQPIAVLVQDIENFETIHLTPKETDIVVGKIDMQRTQTLFLEVYAIDSDIEHPVILDEMKQFPLLTKISYIALLSPSAEEIWSWESPSFKKTDDDPIQSLQDIHSIK